MANRTIMFQPQFVPLIEQNSKRQTIKPIQKRVIQVGDSLSLRAWEGLPYRSPQRVIREVACTFSGSIYIDEPPGDGFIFEIDGVRLEQEHWARLARDDGFACTTDLLDWFRKIHGLPFEGVLIAW